MRYLGVPLSCTKLSISDYKPFLEKITAKISSWTSRYLSYARRLQLVDSVLTSLYSYWCSVFLLPKHLIKTIERLCSSFLWKGRAGNVVGARVSLSLVYRPKSEGGLGLKRVDEWNKSSLARIIRLLFSGSESLWIAWVKEVLLKNKSFWSIQPSANSSWCWRRLLKITYKVGTGSSIYFWFDNWHPKVLSYTHITLRLFTPWGCLCKQSYLPLLINPNGTGLHVGPLK